jgi:glycosyltransferase involved in cell wall biosynthesis
MRPRPLFSVLCSVKNRAPLIRRCVESVLAQDDPTVDFVVQDGASTDGTLDILREYGDRIRLVSEPDAGAGDGLFRALRRARGEFWGSCLSDEQLAPDAVSWARRTFAEHPALGGIYGYAEGVDRDGARLSRQEAGRFSLEDLLTYRQLPPFVASFFRMTSYRQLGLWDYTGGGEHDLWLRFAVRFPIRRFPQLVAHYGFDRSALSNQAAIYKAERAPRLEALRRLFHDDPAGRPFQHLEARAYAGYFLRFAGMFVRNADWDLARESYHQARAHWPACAAGWLPDGRGRLMSLHDHLASSAADPTRLGRIAAHLHSPSRESCAAALRFLPDEAEQLRLAWLQYTLEHPFNLWTLLPALGIRRVALFGGEGWGLALHRQLESAGVRCVAVIDNNASTRQAAMIPAPYFSLPDFLARGDATDAVLSSLQGDHDRDVLADLQEALPVPVVSWKMLFAPLAERPAGVARADLVAVGGSHAR